MMLVSICLIFPVIGLSAGGVLHHREHAAKGLANNHHQSTIPYGGNGHGALGNYVGGITPRPYDRQGEEKLRVIKITRTYAIPYPVPVPLSQAAHHAPAGAWSSANLALENGGIHSSYQSPTDHSYHGPNGDSYHSSTGNGYHVPTGGGYHGPSGSGYHGPTGISGHFHGFSLDGGDISHNSLEYTGPSEFFTGHGADTGNRGFNGYSGGNQGFSGEKPSTLQDDVYQRHGYSTSKPFRPSQEYTPPELNEHLFGHGSQW